MHDLKSTDDYLISVYDIENYVKITKKLNKETRQMYHKFTPQIMYTAE